MSGTDSTIAPTPTPTLAQPDLPLALNSNGPIVATPSLEPPSIITMRSETPVEPNSLEGSDQDEGQLFLSEEPGGSRFFGKAAPSYLYVCLRPPTCTRGNHLTCRLLKMVTNHSSPTPLIRPHTASRPRQPNHLIRSPSWLSIPISRLTCLFDACRCPVLLTP